MNEKKEYIERGALIDSFEDCYYLYNSTDRETVRQAIENAPAADVAPVVHGEWVKTSEFMPIYGCSICKERNLFKNGGVVFSNYCPNCGAKMDGGSDAS